MARQPLGLRQQCNIGFFLAVQCREIVIAERARGGFFSNDRVDNFLGRLRKKIVDFCRLNI
jgi:hypothetical protein